MPASTSPLKISIIIATYNRARFIGPTIESFLEQDYPKDAYEIVVVDNNSPDDTKDSVQSFVNNKQKVKVRYIFEGRSGNHFARNTAAKTSKSDILYFADDDVIADVSLLSQIVVPFKLDPEVAVATGRILPKWEVPPPEWVKKHLSNSLLSLMDPPEDLIITKSINYVFSCHQAIRRDVFMKAEGFNPEQFGGVTLGNGEDGLNSRIRKLGYKFSYNGKSVTHHVMPEGRMTQAYLNRRLAVSGASHAYRTYQAKQPSPAVLSLWTLKIVVINIPLHLAIHFFRMLWSRDFQLARFFMAYSFYYQKRIGYNFRLVMSEPWRRFARKTDWLSHDTDLEPEIAEYIKK